jgi:AbrB family looped-hinge helix DNA binding protein
MSNQVFVKTAKISSKGQITLPRKIMARLGLQYGDLVDIIDENEIISISPKKNKVDNILADLRKKIKIPANLLEQDLDKAILDAKQKHYQSKKI